MKTLAPSYIEFRFYVSLMRKHEIRQPVMLLNDDVVTVGVGILFLHQLHALNDNLTERPFQ